MEDAVDVVVAAEALDSLCRYSHSYYETKVVTVLDDFGFDDCL